MEVPYFGRFFEAYIPMKKYGIFSVLILFCLMARAQQVTLRKGVILDSLSVGDSIPETFSLYLPSAFEMNSRWPLVLVFDMKGKGRQALGVLRAAAEERGYILAASNTISDSLPISDNILITNRLLDNLASLFPLQNGSIFTAGEGTGGQLAALIPSFVSQVSGVLSIGAALPNTDVLDEKRPFYFLGMVGKSNFPYPDMLRDKQRLDRMGIPNNLIVYDGGSGWPEPEFLRMAFALLALHGVKDGSPDGVGRQILEDYQDMLIEVNRQVHARQPYRAYQLLEELMAAYGGLLQIDSLDSSRRAIRRDRLFREQKSKESNALYKESLMREEYGYLLEEDILTYNFNNLGWWQFQMEELEAYEESGDEAEKYMGRRLKGYINALTEDRITQLEKSGQTDEEALLFLYMLKTIIAPEEYPYYLNVISLSAENDDFGTALFYLEELLKQGYTDKAELYALEHTALLRISPEYNSLIAKYLEEARYRVEPQ